MLSARPERLRDWDLNPERRLKIEGNLPLIRRLAKESTLMLVPTHVSNLDSPMIGLALSLAGLPPFIYGAGLNLFSNSVMGWWMGRLGAYTVDRTKRAEMYKTVLKDYSVRCLTTRHHSLFFPGGTRSRSGAIEPGLKKGLLGTGLVAWQEMLQEGRKNPDVYVVPLTLSFQLVLEANTLINDYLAEAGKQRFIISDDEFAQPRRVAAFSQRVLDLDSSLVARFGQPLDLLGYPVPEDPERREAASKRRRRFVCDADGQVEWDAQRDRVYTNRLTDAIVGEYGRNATVMVTHAAAWAAWSCLEKAVNSKDIYRVVRAPAGRRHLQRHTYLEELRRVIDQLRAGAEQGRWHLDLAATAEGVLDVALDRFGRYHRSRALAARGSYIVIEDPKLCLYYRNRLSFAGLEG
ncbi:MAG: hypothetical protein HN348_24000 [Proteobacteria bacterium]|nr:hypothetical protein [Pseudomonadota bacterium]